MSEFKNVFKSLRIREGLSQEEIAGKIGVGRSAVGNWEQGIRTPELETLEAIADYFNVDMNFLCGKQREEHYIDIRVRQIAEIIINRPELIELFDTVKDIPKDSIESISDFIQKTFKQK